MKKTLLFLSVYILCTFLFCSCFPVTDTAEIKKVSLDTAYPEDDLPLYDDACIYYCDADDSEVTVKYGSEDELDDVADFYMDFLEDEDIDVEAIWHYTGEYLYVHLPENIAMTLSIKTYTKNGIDYFEIDDAAEDGTMHRVYTNPSLKSGMAMLTTDEQITKALIGVTWDSLHKMLMDGSTAPMNPNPMVFYEDGIREDIVNGETRHSTWEVKDGRLYFAYAETGKSYDYKAYIEYYADTDSLILYLKDNDEGEGFWLFTPQS